MKPIRLAFLALVFAWASLAQARPVVIEEAATITRPNASWQDFGRFGVAIDGDYALVSGERFINDPQAVGGFRHEGVVFIYRRSGTTWTHVGRLSPVSTIENTSDNWRQSALAMKDGIAVTRFGITRIFERRGTTWTPMPLSPDLENNLQGPDIEIDGGRILISRKACGIQSTVLRKINGTWAVEGELPGHSGFCTGVGQEQDIHGIHAVVYNPAIGTEPKRAIFYQLNENGAGWQRTTHVEGTSWFSGISVAIALNWPNWAISGNNRRGTTVGYDVGALGAMAPYGLQPVDSWLTPDSIPVSTDGIERFRDLFVQRNWSYDRDTYVVNLFRINDDAVRSSEQVATLQTSDGASLGSKIDSSGNRIIVSGWSGDSGHNTVRVFEVPASLEAPAVQVHDFELASAGAAWQPAAGSTFNVVRVGNTGVYRQASTAGTPSSSIPSSLTTNQAIQVEVTPRAINGPNAWVGLTTRRSGDANYYYVTLRASGAIQLKRLVGGAITTLDSAPATMSVGQKYRLRLESIGTLHRVYLDDVSILTARDATFSEGTAGVITNRASADFDNVIVTPSPFTTIDTHFITQSNVDSWTATSGQWLFDGFGLHQSSLVGYARNITGATTDDQIFQASIRPTGFAGPDNWVGLMARYLDDSNYLYVSLRARGVISLWRRQPGALTQLAQTRLTVTPGTWYTVRVEVVAGRTRVFVNEKLVLASNSDPGPDVPNVSWSKGQVGVITYKATADFTDVLVYQP